MDEASEQAETGAEERAVEVEGPRRLSESLLFTLQRRFFERGGVRAWSEGGVPSWITTNPFMARAYARLVDAFRRDFARAGGTEPLTVIELGAGPGRFGYLFLRAMDEARKARGEREPPIFYVMTDGNPSLVHYWRDHAALEPFVDEGWVDFAHYDLGRPADPWLSIARRPLSEAGRRGPLVVLANYVFDCIPQDAFAVEDGRLHEVLVSLFAAEDPPDPLDPDLLTRLDFAYTRREVPWDVYRDPALDGPLGVCAREAGAASVVFPFAALRTLEHLSGLAGGRLLLLSADKGYHRVEDVRDRPEPDIVLHGCFSLGVDFRAIGAYFDRSGGAFLFARHRHTHLDVCAFLRGFPSGSIPELRRVYREVVEEGGPEDYFHLTNSVGGNGFLPTVEESLALLRLSAFDAKVLGLCRAGLLKHLPEAEEEAKQEFRGALRRIRGNYYHIGEGFDLPFELGFLSIHAGDHEGALAYFEESLALYGPSESTTWNIALCRERLGAAPAVPPAADAGGAGI
jgi:hypothetical protein